jgi:outer membrane immunogenic protein
MKKLLLASTAAVFSGSVFAADLPAHMPAKAPMVAVAAPSSWTGCYVGAHAGAGWAHTGFSDSTGNVIAPVGDVIGDNSGTSFIGGGQLGCDYQFATNWVVGLAGDFSWANIDGQVNDPFFAGKNPGPLTVRSRTDFIASATGRLGYAWDHYLLYAKGGAAWSHDKYDVNNFACFFTACFSNATATRSGWTAGGGLEWAFAPSWSVLVEYDHYGFGTKSYTLVDPNNPAFPAAFNVKQDLDVVKIGVNYRFSGLFR